MFKFQLKLKPTLSRAIFCFLFVLPYAHATTANPDALCNDMKVLIKQAHSNFSEKADTRPRFDAEKCTMARSLSGTNTYHCAWDFSYRNVEANAAFEAFSQSMRRCFGNGSEIDNDQTVNHPDFYEQRRYQLDQVVVTVSIKDKSALHQTYVFIGVQGAIPE